MSFYTGTSCDAAPLYTILGTGGATFTGYGATAGEMEAGDQHQVMVQAIGTTTIRFATESFTSIAARTVDLPDALPAFTPTLVASTPFGILRFQFTLPAELDRGAVLTYLDGDGTNSLTMSLSPGYLGGSAVDVTAPVGLASATGWMNTWAPSGAGGYTWSAAGTGGTLTGACTAGRFVTSLRFGSF